jgi:hypothetical protein
MSQGGDKVMDKPEQDAAIVAVISAFIRDAHYLADLAVTFLEHLGLNHSNWNAAFLLELGAVLRIRQWEVAGIKDAIDPELPCFGDSFADLAQRLQSEPDQFLRGETPLLQRVVQLWWYRCAHPNNQFLNVDFVLSQLERTRLLSCVAQLLWKLRDLDTNSTLENFSNER